MRLELLAVLLALQATPPSAKALEAMAGVWTVVEISPTPNGTGSAAALEPPDLTVTVTGATITTSWVTFGKEVRETKHLDGRESTTTRGAMTRVTRSRWTDGRMLTEGSMSQVTSQGFASWTMKEAMYLDPKGRLIAEQESVADDGKVHRSRVTYVRRGRSR